MAPRESEHSPEKMRQVARAMQTELEKLKSGSSGHPGSVGTIGAWDVPTELGRQMNGVHQSMTTYVEDFVHAYEFLITHIQNSANKFDLSELASRKASERAGGQQGPAATYESQN